MLQLLQQQQTAQLEMKRNEQLARSMMMPGQPVQAMVSIPMNPYGLAASLRLVGARSRFK